MNGWVGIVIAAALLASVCLLSVTAEARFENWTFTWEVKIGGLHILPRRKKQEQNEADKPASAQESGGKKAPDMAKLRRYADFFADLLKRYEKRLHIDTLRICFLSAFDDPYDTAMAYSYAGVAMEAITGIAGGEIRRLRLHTDLDFDAQEPKLDAYIHANTRLLVLVRIYLAIKREMKRIRKQEAKEKENVQSTDR